MIKHIVCYKLLNPSAEVLAKAEETFLSMKGRIDEIRELAVGIDKLRSPRSYDMVLEVVFDDFEAMKNYQNNPYHVNVVKKYMHSVVDKSVSVDFEF